MDHALHEYLRPLFALATGVAVIAYFSMMSDVLVRLEVRHREIWQRFGSAKLMPSSFTKQFLLNRFIALGEYYALGDSELSRKASLARFSLFAILILIVLAPLVASSR